MNYKMTPIGVVHSPFKQKFAIPRQPGLCDKAVGSIELTSPYNDITCLKGIAEFSHLWIHFIFHKTIDQGWSNLVRPPRLGGAQKLGVFATRSTFRPNPIGLSVVKNLGVIQKKGKILIKIGGIDLLNETPVIDIKPYLPYADSISTANGGFANDAPLSSLKVKLTSDAEEMCLSQQASIPMLKDLIVQVLSQDPRPAYKKKNSVSQEYAIHLYDFNIRWKIESDLCSVFAIEPIK